MNSAKKRNSQTVLFGKKKKVIGAESKEKCCDINQADLLFHRKTGAVE